MLSGAGWAAYATDARGHGESDWAPGADYSVEAMVADLKAIVSQLPSLPVIVGASMGGVTGLIAEGELGGIAKALVLVDITPHVETDGVNRVREFMTGRPEGFGSLEEVAAAVQAYQPHRDRPVNPESMRKNVRLRDGRWHWHWDPAFTLPGKNFLLDPERMETAARQIKVPTLLVRGEHSDVVSTDAVDELLALIPGSRAVEVHKAGHMVAGDDNAVFLSHVGEFLDQLDQEVRSADRL
jgi:pimeloyl-ACP methyl ester carboxylesterase